MASSSSSVSSTCPSTTYYPTEIPLDLESVRISIQEMASFQELKKSVKDLANPFVLKDIIDALERIESTDLDMDYGILSCFNSFILPEDLWIKIKTFNQEIKNYCGDEKIDQKVEGLKAALATFREMQRHTYSSNVKRIWKELELLLQIEPIKKLDNETVKKLFEEIQSKNVDEVFDFIERIFQAIHPDKGIDEVFSPEIEEILGRASQKESEEDLAPTDLYDVLEFAIKKRPTQELGILSHYDEPSDFFIGKGIHISDTEKGIYHSGIIESCEKIGHLGNPESRWKFRLHDNSEIVIQNLSKVYIINNDETPLWQSIRIGKVKEDQDVDIKNTMYSTFSLKNGSYFLSIEKTKPGAFASAFKWFKSLYEDKEDKEKSGGIVYKIQLVSNKNPEVKHIFAIEGAETIHGFERKRIFICSTGQEISFSIFDSLQIRTIELQETGINRTNIEECIKLRNEKDENLIKLKTFQETNKELESIRLDLVENQEELLIKLINSLIANNLKNIDDKILVNTVPGDQLNLLSRKYREKLGILREPSEILRTIVLEANYQRLIAKKKEVEVSNTMNLLRDAMISIEKIKGKDTVFFIGNTGAGKSTAVGFLLGAKMEEFINHAGDRAIRYAPGQDENALPKIGQSLGQSETLYTTGYLPSPILQRQIRKDTIAIGDCPGFLDTRGSEYELCTNLSIDEAVRHTASIEAVVAVAPASSFLADKANPILTLIETVRDKFSFAFSTGSENDKVFLLITKCKHIQQETLEKLKDGTRFALLLEEIDRQMRELQKKIADTEASTPNLQMESLERRKRTWESLVNMHNRKQIDYIDIDLTSQPRTLLKKYSEKKGSHIRKSSYSKAMDNGVMQEKFGKSVEMSVNTWEYHIFRKFLEEIPKSLETYERNIGEKRTFLDQKTRQQEEKSNEIISLESNIEKLKKILEKDEIPEADVTEFQSIQTDKMSRLSRLIATNLEQITEKESLLATKKAEITDLENERKEKERRISELISRNNDLSSGEPHTEVLWEMKYDKKESITTGGTWKSDQHRKDAFLRGDGGKHEDFIPGSVFTVVAQDYTGNFTHTAYIEKTYAVMPKDPEMRKAFETAIGEGKLSFSSGAYKATLDGKHFSCDLGMIAEPTGKKIRYGLTTFWKKGRDLPWIKISHSTPKSEYNEAEIINNDGIKKACEKRISEINGTLEINKKTKTTFERDIIKLRESITNAKQELSDEKQLETRTLISQMLKQHEIDVESKKREKEDLSLEIRGLKEEEESLIHELEKKKEERRHLALLIVSEWETCTLLRQFSEIVLGEPSPQIGQRFAASKKSSTVNSCKSFAFIYDKHADELLKKAQESLAEVYHLSANPSSPGFIGESVQS